MADTFKTGDVVVLKGGGPRMTVRANNPYYIETQWFDLSTLKNGFFNEESLEKDARYYATKA